MAAKNNEYQRDAAYKIYMSDSLNLLSKALLRVDGGGVPQVRYVELITPQKDDGEEPLSEEEIIENLRAKIRGITGGKHESV